MKIKSVTGIHKSGLKMYQFGMFIIITIFLIFFGGEGCFLTQCRIAGVVAEVLDCFVHVFLIEKCGDVEARN